MYLVSMLLFVDDSRNDHRFCVVSNNDVNGAVVSTSDKGALSVVCTMQIS